MPLNIDWQQILLHLFNFIILAAGLTFFLFKPVKKFMSDRAQKYKKAADDYNQTLAATEAAEKERQVKIAALDGELAEREKQSLAATEARTNRIIADAHEEAEKILADSRKRAEIERAKYIAEVGNDITDMVVLSAEKLLVSESNASTDGALYDKYLALAKDAAPASDGAGATPSARTVNQKDRAIYRREQVADIIGDAAASAIMAQGAANDSAVYDQFLSEVNKDDGKE